MLHRLPVQRIVPTTFEAVFAGNRNLLRSAPVRGHCSGQEFLGKGLSMDPITPSGINRRALLSTLALAPALSGLLRPVPAAAQAGAADDPIAIVERWGGEAGHPRLRARHHRPVQPELCPSGGAHRDIRSGRNAVGRASDVLAGGLLPGSRPGRGGEAAGTQERRALQDRSFRQSGGDGEIHDEGSRKDPRRDADRHDGGGIQCRGDEVDRNARHPRWRVPTPI